MRFEWNPAKAAENLRKHRVSFEEACTIFADASILTMHDDAHSTAEDRWVSIGMSMVTKTIVVVHMWPEPDDAGEEVLRIISARRTNKREREVYLERRK